MNNKKFIENLEKSMTQYTAIGEIINRQNAMLASIGKQLSTAEWFKASETSSGVFDFIKSISVWSDAYSKQISSMAEGLSLIGKRIAADLAAMNLSAFKLDSLGIFDEFIQLVDYHKDSTDAFKSAGWTIAPSMNRELRERIVLLYQQNKSRYISQVILGYYHKNNFENLKNTVAAWQRNLLFCSRMHIFKAALKAHCDGAYALSVPTLLPQVEGILNEYVMVNNLEAKLGKINNVYNAVIGDPGKYPLSSWAIANTLLYQLQTSTFTFTDFETEFKKSSNSRRATRHTILHGIAVNYDKPVHSLKTFVLLDALSALRKPA